MLGKVRCQPQTSKSFRSSISTSSGNVRERRWGRGKGYGGEILAELAEQMKTQETELNLHVEAMGVKMDNSKKRKPLLAFFLSVVAPGLGQIYNGQFKKGISYLVGFYLVYILSSFLLPTFYGMIFYLMVTVGFFFFIVIDALRGANKLKAITLKPFNKWYVYLIIFVISNVAVRPFLGLTIRNHIVRPYKIRSNTMVPALLVGDRLIADMRDHKSQKPQRGDIVIFEYPKDPSKDFIKRVIGTEGEKVEILKNKIYIDDQLLDDPWGYFEDGGFVKKYFEIDTFEPVVVPKDALFVLGDNRNNSQDSRHWGFVNIEKVKGRALYLYWAKNKNRIGMKLVVNSNQ
jgi:signal peptidase I